MALLRDVIGDLADQIRGVMDASGVVVQVEPRIVTNPTPPTIDMFPADPPVTQESAGMGDLQGGDVWTVRARVTTGDSDAGHDLLVDLMDVEHDLSLAAAIMSDPTLGGSAGLSLQGWSGLRSYADPEGNGAYLGAEWTVLVMRTPS